MTLRSYTVIQSRSNSKLLTEMLPIGHPDGQTWSSGLRSGPAQQATGLLFYSPISATDNFPSMLVPVFTAPPHLVTASTRARGGRRKIQAAIDPLPSKLPAPSALCVIVAATPYLIH